MKKEGSRFYAVSNMYLSPIQQREIQPGHVVSELFVKYRRKGPKPAQALLWDWAESQKTWIVLEGGYQSELLRFARFLSEKNNPFPWALFKEEKSALNSAVTSVGIVLPERVYSLRRLEEQKRISPRQNQLLKKVTPWERKLAEWVSIYPLAKYR